MSNNVRPSACGMSKSENKHTNVRSHETSTGGQDKLDKQVCHGSMTRS